MSCWLSSWLLEDRYEQSRLIAHAKYEWQQQCLPTCRTSKDSLRTLLRISTYILIQGATKAFNRFTRSSSNNQLQNISYVVLSMLILQFFFVALMGQALHVRTFWGFSTWKRSSALEAVFRMDRMLNSIIERWLLYATIALAVGKFVESPLNLKVAFFINITMVLNV